MNVFDFDNTIYDGESAIDFFLYYLKKDPKLIRYLPSIIVAMHKYRKGTLSIEQALSQYGAVVGEYIVAHGGVGDEIEDFWNRHMKKIKPLYADLRSEDDLVISCSPEFSLDVICKRLGIARYIGTVVDEKTGEFKRLCFRENKVKAFEELYPGQTIDKFYTDSVNDTPLIEISREAYLVKGNKVTKIK